MNSITECLEGVDFQWSKSAQRAFEHIKTLMTEAPVTALPYFGKLFIVEWHRTYWGICLQVLLVGLGLGELVGSKV